MYGGLSINTFLKQYPTKGKILNIGSGPRIINSDIINVDIYKYVGVKIIIDGETVPLESGTVSRIISETVLEHVSNPHGAVKEMHRLLSPGGYTYVTTPFLYPFHSSPSDYQRWTKEGLIQLFHEFEVIEIGVRAGPFSSLTVFINHLFAVIFSFGSVRAYDLILNFVMFLTFPVKLLDLIFNHWPQADTMAAVLYCVVRKK